MSDLIKHYRQQVGVAKSWALKNLPGWSEESHRDLLSRHGAREANGHVSATTLPAPGLKAVLSDYQRRGWIAGKPGRPIPPRIAHLVRLWGRLGQAGKLKNAGRRALLAFCERQTRHKVLNLDSLSVEESQAITEALKSWLARDGAASLQGG